MVAFDQVTVNGDDKIFLDDWQILSIESFHRFECFGRSLRSEPPTKGEYMCDTRALSSDLIIVYSCVTVPLASLIARFA